MQNDVEQEWGKQLVVSHSFHSSDANSICQLHNGFS